MKIYQAITAAMKDIDAIGKNKKNLQQGYSFRGIDDAYNALHGILAKHGIFTVPQVLGKQSEERKTAKGGTLIFRIIDIKYIFYADDGSCVEAVVVGEAMDSGDKASNKAMSTAHKYALLQVFAIPTEDLEDNDAPTIGAYISEEHILDIEARLSKTNSDSEKFLAAMKVVKISDMTEEQYKSAVKLFEAKMRKK